MASGTVLPPPINITGSQQRGLAPLAVPPTTLLRVIPGIVWTKYTWVDWLEHVAARHAGGAVLSPRIGKDTATQMYVTDEPSLDGYLEPAGIARRLGLPASTHVDCNKYGVVIIRFTIADPTVAVLPPPSPLATQQGLTTGYAREWLIPNKQLDAVMDVIYIGFSPAGDPFWYFVPLKD